MLKFIFTLKNLHRVSLSQIVHSLYLSLSKMSEKSDCTDKNYFQNSF